MVQGFLIYGANGYTGRLVTDEALKRGLRPILAGRNLQTIAAMAEQSGLEYRHFTLDDADALDSALRDVAVVLHCAGPFGRTSRPMVDGCLRNSKHYLDITGEIAVFEAISARDDEAKKNGVLLMPGVGFDVVPTDCLAAHLKHRLPTATHLALAISSQGKMSRGTATTIVESLDGSGMIRKNGALTRVPGAWKTRSIDFGSGPIKAITIPWGDVATAYHSTGIPNIEVYVAAPFSTRVAARLVRHFGWLFKTSAVQGLLKHRIQRGPPGPTPEERERGASLVWGQATDDTGASVVSRLRGPEGYTFTALAALTIVERVLAGNTPTGFQTPALAYGADLVLELPGVTRTDDQKSPTG
jgi:short subunit dehydrogenase-like uncharacterized protein